MKYYLYRYLGRNAGSDGYAGSNVTRMAVKGEMLWLKKEAAHMSKLRRREKRGTSTLARFVEVQTT